ncbi:hypothetical protein FA868_15050 [Escherichia coli]|nr:hypothetical protein [Escherichia coli]EFC9524954.1 hypothetical protein [Escherichia coli]
MLWRLSQIISSVVIDALRREDSLIWGNGRGWWVLAAPTSYILMRWGHKQTSALLLCAKAVGLSETGLMTHA